MSLEDQLFGALGRYYQKQRSTMATKKEKEDKKDDKKAKESKPPFGKKKK
jgi:hypothetical protein